MNSSANEKVLFKKKKGGGMADNDNDNAWDDTELIKMYEKSTSQAYEKAQNAVIEAEAGGASSSIPIDQQTKWKVGDKCMAPYEEDGKWYAATIESIDAEKSTCLVNFTGYDGCKERVPLKELVVEDEVEWVSGDDEMDGDTEQPDKTKAAVNGFLHSNNMGNIKPINNNIDAILTPTTITSNNVDDGSRKFPLTQHCPPPPPSLFENAIAAGSEKEAMTNALMSWYMAGYHTGYYQGMLHHQQEGKSGK